MVSLRRPKFHGRCWPAGPAPATQQIRGAAAGRRPQVPPDLASVVALVRSAQLLRELAAGDLVHPAGHPDSLGVPQGGWEAATGADAGRLCSARPTIQAVSGWWWAGWMGGGAAREPLGVPCNSQFCWFQSQLRELPSFRLLFHQPARPFLPPPASRLVAGSCQLQRSRCIAQTNCMPSCPTQDFRIRGRA